MNRSYTYKKNYKKKRTSGFRKFMRTYKGRKIIKARRNKKRKILG